jgi:hypothetical protein
MRLTAFAAAMAVAAPALAQTNSAPAAPPTAPAAARPAPRDPASLAAAQQQAMSRLAMMDGLWRGTAWSTTPTGRHDVTHTERVGPFLGGALKVIEGRSYRPDGSVGFNALGIVSYDPQTEAYTLHSYAMGHAGDFALKVEPDGYSWEVPAGPGATIRYRATIGNGAWKEVGFRVAGEAPPLQIFEMNLKRIADTRWPAADPVPMK